MINGSFVFGMDAEREDVFQRTVDWAIDHGITTATFHIQTPYPATALHARMVRAGRMLTRNWDLYDTRHVVYRPAQLQPEVLKAGYDWAYREFYRWGAIARASLHHGTLKHQAKHFFLCVGVEEVRARLGSDDPVAPADASDSPAGRSPVARKPGGSEKLSLPRRHRTEEQAAFGGEDPWLE